MNEAAKTVTSAGVPGCAEAALHGIAQRLLWWQPAVVSLKQPARLIVQVMALGTWKDVRTVWGIFGDEAMREALRQAPPGVFDLRSWTYWHHVFGWLPVPPLPRRNL